MENYTEYLQERIRVSKEKNQLTETRVLQECLDAHLSFADAVILKEGLGRVVVIGGGRSIGKAARFAERYGTIGPAVHLAVGSASTHVNMEKAFEICEELSKNGPIQEKFTQMLDKATGVTIQESILRDRSFALRPLPVMTKPLIPLDKYGKQLENPKSDFHK